MIQRSRFAAVAFVLFALAVAPALVGAQSTANLNGAWNVTYDGQPLSPNKMVLQQQGPTVIGTFGTGGRVQGKVNASTGNVDLAWFNGDREGWATIVPGADGKSFSGQWGLPGKKPSGTFIASKIFATFPPVTGLWRLSTAGGAAFPFNGVVKFQQTGSTVVGSFANVGQIAGTFKEGTQEMDGTWKAAGKSGWVTLQFLPDNTSVQGAWGRQGSNDPAGRIVGAVNTFKSPITTGLWTVRTSGKAFSMGNLRLHQQGETVIGSFGTKGRISGTLREGSDKLIGTWKTPANGSGPIVLRFTKDGMAFDGVLSRNGVQLGRVIGKRVTASSAAVRAQGA